MTEERKHVREKTLDYKQKHKHKTNAKLLLQMQEEQIIARDNLGTCGSGAAITASGNSRNERNVRQNNRVNAGLLPIRDLLP